MFSLSPSFSIKRWAAVAVAAGSALSAGTALAWEPTKPVEFVVPAGTGGGADQMARLIQGIVVKHKLMKESMVVVNKSGGAGAEGFLSVKEAKGVPSAMEMIRELVDGKETVVRTARETFPAAERAGDQVSMDLLTQRLQVHEKNAWMLRSLLE